MELRDGRHLAREWGEKRRLIEETGARGEGLIPWNLFDPDTLGWFVGRLSPKAEGSPAEIICERLSMAERRSTRMSVVSLSYYSAQPRLRERNYDAM